MEASPRILDGKWLASLVQKAVFSEVEKLRSKAGRGPGLGVVLVGDNPASKAYVSGKEKFAKACGFETFDSFLPSTASAQDVSQALRAFNQNEKVDGILLQLPLPGHLRSNELLDLIDPTKDADGLHPLNQGLLLRGEGTLRPCTPLGVMKLIDVAYSNVTIGSEAKLESIPRADLAGKNVVVIGRSILVGKTVSFLLLERNATVTIAHSKTADLAGACRQSDIVVAAVGVPHMVKANWVKKGAVVIDVGINRLSSGQLTGDVAFDEVAPLCSAITPVPKGVGPMTVAMLMQNTLHSFKGRV